ncbi:MAG: aminoacyl-tRNA hydrolase [Alphaproteobacteria bacterium]
MLLLVGLGNPGPSHARNRHNVGFMALDRIVQRHSFGPMRDRFHAQSREGSVGDHRALALKPQTYMNLSGRAVAAAMRFYKVQPADVFVLHDEIDLSPGKVRAKCGGGTAGHNGLRSIEDYIGPEFWRVRIGVGRPEGERDAAGYVLQNFGAEDKVWLDPVLEAIALSLPLLLAGAAPRFMNDVARMTAPPKPKRPKPAPGADAGANTGANTGEGKAAPDPDTGKDGDGV